MAKGQKDTFCVFDPRGPLQCVVVLSCMSGKSSVLCGNAHIRSAFVIRRHSFLLFFASVITQSASWAKDGNILSLCSVGWLEFQFKYRSVCMVLRYTKVLIE